MKNLFVSAFAVFVVAFGLSACSPDDDNNGNDTSLPAHMEGVDLGLPSGIKWCNMNVGAKSPEDYGDYFAWGDTIGRGADWATDKPYKWSNAPFTYGEKNFSQSHFRTVKDTVCPDGILIPKYDAATKICGEAWRMPTVVEWAELYENCSWEWTDNYKGKGVAGYIVYKVKVDSDKGVYKASDGSVGRYRVVAYIGGASWQKETATLTGTYSADSDTHIFLPAAGQRNYSTFQYGGKYGYYWSSALGKGVAAVSSTSDYKSMPDMQTEYYAYNMYFTSTNINISNRIYHYYGLSVRPILSPKTGSN